MSTIAPLIVTGTGCEPFYVPSHIRSVGHQLIIGPTTGGKSTLLGTIVAALAVLPNVRIVWLDRDYSSFVLTHAMGGVYIELATDNSSPLCPFQWIEIENGAAWLFDWFTRLFKRWQIDINERQAADLATALELAKASGIRTMTGFMHLIHDPAMRGVLRNYAAGGQWAHVFDGEPASSHRNLLTTYEMRYLDALGERAAGPGTEFIVHDTEVGLGESPTFVVIDDSQGSGMRLVTTDGQISNSDISSNLFENIDTVRQDTGAIYLRDTSASARGIWIQDNAVLGDGPASNKTKCIYLDDGTSNVTVEQNICAASGTGSAGTFGVFIHAGTNNQVADNTLEVANGTYAAGYQTRSGANTVLTNMSGNQFKGLLEIVWMLFGGF